MSCEIMYFLCNILVNNFDDLCPICVCVCVFENSHYLVFDEVEG